jgi:hypothetical protein
MTIIIIHMTIVIMETIDNVYDAILHKCADAVLLMTSDLDSRILNTLTTNPHYENS